LNPNTHRLAGTPQWKQWTEPGKQRLVFRTNATMMAEQAADEQMHCAYFESIGVAVQQ
jgi:hypothetical protein